jgi:hypothetical protein
MLILLPPLFLCALQLIQICAVESKQEKSMSSLSSEDKSSSSGEEWYSAGSGQISGLQLGNAAFVLSGGGRKRRSRRRESSKVGQPSDQQGEQAGNGGREGDSNGDETSDGNVSSPSGAPSPSRFSTVQCFAMATGSSRRFPFLPCSIFRTSSSIFAQNRCCLRVRGFVM